MERERTEVLSCDSSGGISYIHATRGAYWFSYALSLKRVTDWGLFL